MAGYLDKLLDKAQQVRMEIQERLGSSGNIINTSDLKRGLRAEGEDNSASDGSDNDPDKDYEKDAKKFFYTSPGDFFENHKRNVEEFIEKHITKPIEKNFGSSDN